jgi:hypothetical protein
MQIRQGKCRRCIFKKFITGCNNDIFCNFEPEFIHNNIMKNNLIIFLVLVVNMICFSTFSQTVSQAENDTTLLGLPGDNLDLFAVLNLFQKSKTIEDFEKSLNEEKTGINNLDLDLNNKVDFIKVVTKQDGTDFTFVLQVDVSEKEVQDVAVILVSKDKDGKVTMQAVGDKDLYGKDYVIEPAPPAPAVTANPAYTGPEPVTVSVPATTTVVVVESAPIVQYVYSPVYVPYYPPYHYAYYPPYYAAFTVMAVSVYRHNNYYYHGGYHGGGYGNTVVIHNTNNYNNYNNSRNSSNTVNHNNANGSYNRNNASTRPSTGTSASTRPSTGTSASTRPSTGTSASTRPSTGTSASTRPSTGTSSSTRQSTGASSARTSTSSSATRSNSSASRSMGSSRSMGGGGGRRR